jgi:hypothetical protein
VDYDISRTGGVTMRPQFDPAFTLGAVWYAPAVKRPVRWTVVTRASELNVLSAAPTSFPAYRPA